MTYGMQLPYGQQYGAQGVQYAGGYPAQQQYNTQVNRGYNVGPAQSVNPVAAMWNRGTQWMGQQVQRAYGGYQRFAQERPYVNAAVSAGAGMLTAMHSCPYAGAAVATPALLNAAKNMFPGHPNVQANAGGGNQYANNGGYTVAGRTFG